MWGSVMNDYNRLIYSSVLIMSALSGCSLLDDPEHKMAVLEVLKQVKENMVFVEGGTFMMGDSGDGKEISNFTADEQDDAIKNITIDSYFINKYETTWGEFVIYLKDTGKYDYKPDPKSKIQAIHAVDKKDSPYYFKRPALAPSWEEANNYCIWLSEKTQTLYALPTEVQWEYAARSGGKRVRFATEDGLTLNIDDYMAGEYKGKDPDTGKVVILEATDPFAKPKGNAFVYSSGFDFKTLYREVGSYAPNALGIHDMTGNAKEWTADWYDKKYYQYLSEKNPSGPKGPVEWEAFIDGEKIPKKTMRDWIQGNNYWAYNVSLYVRGGKDIEASNIGFRCVQNAI